MKRSDLINLISAENPNLSNADADRLVRIIFDMIANQLVAGGRVELRGFGVFDVKQRNARSGRNPRTGDAVSVEEKRVLYFRTGKELRDRLNAQSEADQKI
jgi:integration host factor subunit beta